MVARTVRDRKVAGSNPAAPTTDEEQKEAASKAAFCVLTDEVSRLGTYPAPSSITRPVSLDS